MAQADSEQSLSEFVAGLCQTDADDPFVRWLRDNKSMMIDWSTLGIEKIRPESQS
jgi:hypothetical protein